MTTEKELPAYVALLDMMRGYRLPQALYLAVRLGIPDLIGDAARTASDLASELHCHARSLERMLRALSSAGVFTEISPGTFAHSAMSRYLRRDDPETRRPSILFLGAPYTQATWMALEHSVRTGTSAFRHVHGVSKWEYYQRHPEEGAVFDQIMAAARPLRLSAVVDTYDFSGASVVVDVGGGYGHLVSAVLQRHPAVRGVLLDMPDLMPRARELLAAAGLEDRCELVSGSFFESVPGGDVLMLSDILHDWPDEESLAILRACRASMNARGRVLVIEDLLVPCTTPASLASLDLQMLIEFGEGRQRTEHELRELFAAAGLQLSRVIHTSDVSIVEAVAG